MKRSAVGVVLVVLATTGVACGRSKSAAQTFAVDIDGKVAAYNENFTAYFPSETKVHPGDTVTFNSIFRGEPHTVTLGSLVNVGLAAADRAGPQATEEPAELKKIPTLIPDNPTEGVTQAAAQPCFLDSGAPPAKDACATQTQPEFTGRQALFSSGYLPDGTTFSVRLAKDIAPGTYRFFCELHRAAMQGKLTVVDKGTKVPDAATSAAQGVRERTDLSAKLSAAAQALRTGALPPLIAAAPGQVVAGGGTQDVDNALVDEFGPKLTSIAVGKSVTWVVLGPHTISFNAPEDARPLIIKDSSGHWQLNFKGGAPNGGPGQPQGPPPAAAAPSGPPRPTVIDAGAWDGTGFHSSGLILSFPPSNLFAYKLTFSKAGTYQYKCLVHPDMEGTIKVG